MRAEQIPPTGGDEGRDTPGPAGVCLTLPAASAFFKDPTLLLHCYMCQQEKSAYDFHRDSGRPSGYASRCRLCAKTWNKVRPGAPARRKRARKAREVSLRKRGRPRKPRAEGHLCRSCKFVMHADAFWSDATRSDGISRRCKNCVTARERNEETHRAQRKRHKKKYAWRKALKRNYGLTPDDYQRMFEDQGGKCAICKRPPGKKRLAVDHCHRTDKIRGLLCHRCNVSIGFMGDSPSRARATIGYLKAHQQLTIPETP